MGFVTLNKFELNLLNPSEGPEKNTPWASREGPVKSVNLTIVGHILVCLREENDEGVNMETILYPIKTTIKPISLGYL